ncbi:MAG: dTMP kinase [Gemmatimonadetes bacterium]|nr:dTMP kinase [Gemmatimonadota bacterium]
MKADGAGRFLVLEGIEGTGKSTQGRRLAARLRERGIEVVETREPGGTEVGERIRSLVLHAPDLDIPSEAELFLILAARSAFVRQVVNPALARGAWVLSDRFDLSTFAYQGYGRGIDLDTVATLNEVATGGRAPDLTLVLDVDPEESQARQSAEGDAPDRIEAEGSSFLARVRQGYVDLVGRRPEAVLISGVGSVEEVENRVWTAVVSGFPQELRTPEGLRGPETIGGSAV